MTYIATYYLPGDVSTAPQHSRSYNTLDGALRLLTRGMDEGQLYPGEIVDQAGRTCVSHDWLLDHWSDVVRVMNAGRPASAAFLNSRD